MSRRALCFLLFILWQTRPLQCKQASAVCLLEYCDCNPAAHPSWTIVNCTVPSDKKLDIVEGDLPETTTDLVISGGDAVVFGTNSLSRLKDARLVRVVGARLVLMRKFAAVNLNVVNVFLDIEQCDVLRIEERTFTNIKGPLSVVIKQCSTVTVEGEAFSWLLTLAARDVRRLQLSAGAFMLDASAANVGEHGPGMKIELSNVTVPEFTSQTFGSSAASITMDLVQVQDIRQGAFAANTYNVLTANNCTFDLIHGEAFSQKSLINNLNIYGSRIRQLASRSLLSAVANLNISHTMFDKIETGAINITVATVAISDCEFNIFEEKGLALSSWNKLRMRRNLFDELAINAIVANGVSVEELAFTENEIETAHPNSLAFIGHTEKVFGNAVTYESNYFGQPCYCNITSWLTKVLNTNPNEMVMSQTYCTVDKFFARCFNAPEQNLEIRKFIKSVCGDDSNISCEPYKTKIQGKATEIKNPRFPHKSKERVLSHRNAKVIGIVIVTVFGCILIAMLFSLIGWMRKKGYCLNIKNLLLSSNTCCASFCDRICPCGGNSGLDNAGSISRLSVLEYSERHLLNEPRRQEIVQETSLPELETEILVSMDDKTTQTLPEELTKELLENLKQKLDDPENYIEAREMIEHLYELIKVEESCNTNSISTTNEENIYELPFQNTVPRLGKNKKKMISIGTRTPSLDKLLPLSPYNRQTALAHEYFEPKDFAVHLYAEITNNDRERKHLLSGMPDVVAEQAIPRGPYLRAVREKTSSASPSPSAKYLNSPINKSPIPQHSTIKSNKSNSSNSSLRMLNRPLPEKPKTFDPGEGTSFKNG